MSLTLALSILAGLVLLALVVQSLWSARKSEPRRAEPTPAAPAAPRMEPPLGGDLAPTPAPMPMDSAELVDARRGGDPALAAAGAAVGLAGEAVAPGVEPVMGAAVAETAPVAVQAEAAAPAPAQAPVPAVRRGPRIDALIDVIANLTLDTRVSGDLVLAHLPATRRAGTKPFLVEGLNAATAEWEPPQPGQQYRQLQAGVQLANRHGALNEIEYSEFVQKLQPFADSVGAAVEMPDMLEAVARAKELDHFANQHDAQLAVQLVARKAPWSVSYLQQATLKHGFVPGSLPGRLVLPGAEEGAPPVLVLAFDPQAALAENPNAVSVKLVSLSLDVPQTPEAEDPFGTWLRAMSALAAELEADLVDEAGRRVVPEAFEPIKSELEGLYRQLEGRDLAAGSAAARRLFS
ncbi:cell division protein FtsZ [Azohydromonas caseinilytica]|uniref:Cell division protein FtsZ n=1 Tax=Azohydromonas caseinilytica TaxID=2728836 RepID=A0A848F8X1_9BURK|nr:cell division protein FtsZ [Azohydromonas caseinilytica]NML14481.1 cell division protein FtsZ [Azohydromonas caseinilytica]